MAYLKVTPTCNNSYDTTYYDLKGDDTWASALEYIEMELDAKYCSNDDKLDGIKLEIEIVDQMPDDVEEFLDI